MSLRGKIDFAEITDTGKVRDHNEDAIGSNSEIGLMVLADGMGGYNAGEVASGIAVQIVTELPAPEGVTLNLRRLSVALSPDGERWTPVMAATYRRDV